MLHFLLVNRVYRESLRQRAAMKKRQVPFRLPIIQRGFANHLDDCHLSLTKVSTGNAKILGVSSNRTFHQPCVRTRSHSSKVPIPEPNRIFRNGLRQKQCLSDCSLFQFPKVDYEDVDENYSSQQLKQGDYNDCVRRFYLTKRISKEIQLH